MNTIDINTLDFTNAPAGFDRTDSLMNILIADIDDDKKAIIGFDIDTQKSSIAVGNPTTGKWADSADPPGLAGTRPPVWSQKLAIIPPRSRAGIPRHAQRR